MATAWGREDHTEGKGKVETGAEKGVMRKVPARKACQLRSPTILTRGVRIAAADVPRQRIIKRMDLQSKAHTSHLGTTSFHPATGYQQHSIPACPLHDPLVRLVLQTDTGYDWEDLRQQRRRADTSHTH